MDNINEIPRHRKKKASSISKSKEKAKHKHEYEDCLLIIKDFSFPIGASYCKICGKLNYSNSLQVTNYKDGHYIMFTPEEIYEKYKDLPQFHIDDIGQKYVVVKEGE